MYYNLKCIHVKNQHKILNSNYILYVRALVKVNDKT
jgi:hypothetical protein